MRVYEKVTVGKKLEASTIVSLQNVSHSRLLLMKLPSCGAFAIVSADTNRISASSSGNCDQN